MSIWKYYNGSVAMSYVEFFCDNILTAGATNLWPIKIAPIKVIAAIRWSVEKNHRFNTVLFIYQINRRIVRKDGLVMILHQMDLSWKEFKIRLGSSLMAFDRSTIRQRYTTPSKKLLKCKEIVLKVRRPFAKTYTLVSHVARVNLKTKYKRQKLYNHCFCLETQIVDFSLLNLGV